MSSQITVARNRLLEIWRDTTVATAASVTLAEWANTDQSIGHVFKLASPGAINRGRLPVVNLIFADDNEAPLNDDGGVALITFDVEVIVGGVFGVTAQELAENILSIGERAMRADTGRYWDVMDSSSNGREKGPMWLKLTRSFSAELIWRKESV